MHRFTLPPMHLMFKRYFFLKTPPFPFCFSCSVISASESFIPVTPGNGRMLEDPLRTVATVGHVHYKLDLTGYQRQHLLCHFLLLRKLSTVEAWTSIHTPSHCSGPWISPSSHSFFGISFETEPEMVYTELFGKRKKLTWAFLPSPCIGTQEAA